MKQKKKKISLLQKAKFLVLNSKEKNFYKIFFTLKMCYFRNKAAFTKRNLKKINLNRNDCG